MKTEKAKQDRNSGRRVYRVNSLLELLEIKSRATLYMWEQKGDLPKRRRLSNGVVVWDANEIERWLASRPRGPRER